MYPLMRPDLPYSFSAQEPLIDNTTQMLHWTKHLQAYYENTNKAIAPFPKLQVRAQPLLPWICFCAAGLSIAAALGHPCMLC